MINIINQAKKHACLIVCFRNMADCINIVCCYSFYFVLTSCCDYMSLNYPACTRATCYSNAAVAVLFVFVSCVHSYSMGTKLVALPSTNRAEVRPKCERKFLKPRNDSVMFLWEECESIIYNINTIYLSVFCLECRSNLIL